MSEQNNEDSILGVDGKSRKEWKKPVLVGLIEANGDGAEGKTLIAPGETLGMTFTGPS